MAIIALIAAVIVVLDQERSLTTASTLVRFGFYIAIAFAAYLMWRDFGRREIELWPRRQQIVFYGAVGLALVDLGWYFATPLSGATYSCSFSYSRRASTPCIRTWRGQHHYA